MKSYRSRTLNRRCQLARPGPDGGPLRDEHGNPVLDHGGLWFLHVSGGDHHDRKRLVPEDPAAFFRLKADDTAAALRARGRDRAVTPEMVYAEYVKHFTKPQHTYAPPGRPEEFSVVVPKELCVNWAGAGPRGSVGSADLDVARMSFFAQDADDAADPCELVPAGPPQGDADGPRRKRRAVSATLSELGLE